MAEMVTKSDSGEPQREGTRVVDVTEGGTVQKHGGKDIAASDGFAVINTRWATRSMGNGGAVS